METHLVSKWKAIVQFSGFKPAAWQKQASGLPGRSAQREARRDRTRAPARRIRHSPSGREGSGARCCQLVRRRFGNARDVWIVAVGMRAFCNRVMHAIVVRNLALVVLHIILRPPNIRPRLARR